MFKHILIDLKQSISTFTGFIIFISLINMVKLFNRYNTLKKYRKRSNSKHIYIIRRLVYAFKRAIEMLNVNVLK